ncbi:hypothetical protein [Microbulbifer sp. TYP-18]|uniref:hypothetical protein n=1 Tax=Microbulbifer sp. TYP-18 TaxID=3230024 RepID=UPI0034C6740E
MNRVRKKSLINCLIVLVIVSLGSSLDRAIAYSNDAGAGNLSATISKEQRVGSRASQAAGFAELSETETTYSLALELDTAQQLRQRLYYNEADSVPPEQEDPAAGVYSRDKAAFRYLDLMYVVDQNTNKVTNHFFSGDSTLEVSTLYDTAERNRAAEVEAMVVQQLIGNPGSESMQHLLLDVYYDRAVAEIVLANQALDRAHGSRLSNEAASTEAAYVDSAYQLLDGALVQYYSLLENSPDLLANWSSSRGQISPRYYDANSMAQKDVAAQASLFSGYKDVTMFYQLMSRLVEAKVHQARLMVTSGQADAALGAELATLHSDIMGMEATLRAIFPGVDLMQLEVVSGLPEAVYEWQARMAQLDNAAYWAAGDTSLLGIAEDSIAHVTVGANSDFATALIELLGDENNGFIARAQGSYSTAEVGYSSYHHNADTLAAEYAARHQQFANQLYSLLGVHFTNSCFEISCATTSTQLRENSEISLWSRNIHNSQSTLTRNLQRLEELLNGIELEIETLALEKGINDGLSRIFLDYGAQQLSLAQQLTLIRDEKEAFSIRANHLASLAGAMTQYTDGEWNDVEGLSTSVNQILQSIRSLENVEQLRVATNRLAAEHQMRLLDNTGQILSAGDGFRLEGQWVEANAIALDIAQTEAMLIQEAKRLPLNLNEIQRLIGQVTAENPNLALRSFADPIFSRRLTAAMFQAQQDFREAQTWLFRTLVALEYKWQQTIQDASHYISKDTILSLRSTDELEDSYTKLAAIEAGFGDALQNATDTLSVKEHVFGYVDTIQGVQQLYPHPDPAQQGTQGLTAQQAFREKLKLLSRTFGSDTWITLEFSTAKELPNSTFFAGPVISGSGESACIAAGGTYLDKIETVEINIPILYSSSAILETPAYLTYGGASLWRERVPGGLVETESGTAQVGGEFNAYSALFWGVSGSSILTAIDNSHRVAMKAALSPFGGSSASVNTVTSAFKERSVAATGWRLSFKVADLYGSIVDIAAISDVELIFDHAYKPRNYSNCSGGETGGPLAQEPIVH